MITSASRRRLIVRRLVIILPLRDQLLSLLVQDRTLQCGRFATGACFAFEGTLEASVAATYKIFVDSTLISTPVLSSNGVGGYYIIWKSLYCNTTAQSNQTLTYPAQILYIALSSYSLGGVPSIGQFYGEAPQTTPTAIDWSTSHTITVKVNSSSSGTAVGSMFWIHN